MKFDTKRHQIYSGTKRLLKMGVIFVQKFVRMNLVGSHESQMDIMMLNLCLHFGRNKTLLKLKKC